MKTRLLSVLLISTVLVSPSFGEDIESRLKALEEKSREQAEKIEQQQKVIDDLKNALAAPKSETAPSRGGGDPVQETAKTEEAAKVTGLFGGSAFTNPYISLVVNTFFHASSLKQDEVDKRTIPGFTNFAQENRNKGFHFESVEITALVKPNQDPHMIEARPSMILAVRKADILFYNGLDLEIGYLPVLIESSRNPKIQPGQPGNFDCSRFVTVIEKNVSVDRSMGDVHPLGNPHYHYSANNILKISEGMADALSRLDPANADFYRANMAAFRGKVRKKQERWKAIPLMGKRFLAYHKHFEYLAADYGFLIMGYVEPKPGIPPSAGYLDRLIETIRQTRPNGILTTSYYGRREEDFLSRKTGVKIIVVPHDVGATVGTKDWFSLMDQVLSSLQ